MKRAVLHPIIPMIALLAAGCSGEVTTTDDVADGGGVAAPEAAGWEITTLGFGPFDTTTPYDPDVLAELLPGYELVDSELQSEGSAYPVTLAIPDGAETPSIVVAGIPETNVIFAVAVREPGKITNAAGRIGQTYAEAGFDGMTCWPGAEGRSGDVVCLDPRTSAVGYWLTPEGYEGPDGELPPADVLAGAVIYEIRWTPPA